ncbi:NAD(P)H-quinone oxidoreductase [Paraburkholderia sp. BCC1884]|uniref:NAD(P)H-quinone oxidoreductase n=1 Tax=Paraburkholderia sp. BCC1884 TaxID=2562668 RepID=UPI0011822263|nr:NAD(P)H-quinone oxidoreductase [Paraburkholderia sp. BCC1884]
MNPTQTQQCIMITAAGGPDVLKPRTVAVPSPLDDEVLIQVRAAGVNRHDCHQRQRGPTPAHSDIPGLEVSGVVAAVGRDVLDFQVGQDVCALTDGGGYAEYVVAKVGHVLPMPDHIDHLAAAAVPEAAFTVWHNFFGVARLGPGESVLLHGGTSGVGTFAIQLLSLLGHPVYATCGTPEKVDFALALGASGAFNYRSDDFVESVKDRTGGRGVDVILDMSGGKYSARNIDALARRGRLVHLSPGNGAKFEGNLRDIMLKEIHISGSALRPLPANEKTAIAMDLKRVVLPRLSDGTLRPVLDLVLPLSAAATAHSRMEAGLHMGKILLEVGAH